MMRITQVKSSLATRIHVEMKSFKVVRCLLSLDRTEGQQDVVAHSTDHLIHKQHYYTCA
jgi:hypothetical protein